MHTYTPITNALPKTDLQDNPTGCCPRFQPEEWEEQELHFEDKPFVHVKTRSVMHMPLNMGSVFPQTFKAIEAAQAMPENEFVVLSNDRSAWSSDHYFAVTKTVPKQEMVFLSGSYLTKVFEGPYKDAGRWQKEMERFVAAQGRKLVKNYFYYTTCPKCAKVYGKNYVVGVAEVE